MHALNSKFELEESLIFINIVNILNDKFNVAVSDVTN